jgi:hypothetical protein
MAETLLVLIISGLPRGIFFRGALAEGKIYSISDSLPLGPLLKESESWQDAADWIGVMSAPSVAHHLIYLRDKGYPLPEGFVNYPVPHKKGAIPHAWALAWPKRFVKASGASRETCRGALLELFAKECSSPEHIPKYANTVAFFDHETGQP